MEQGGETEQEEEPGKLRAWASMLRQPTTSPGEARTECWAGCTGMVGHCGCGSYPGCTADQCQPL